MIKTNDVYASGQAAEAAWQTLQEQESCPHDIMFILDIDPMSAF